MSLTEDQVNHIINDQEDAISELKDKLLDMQDMRDDALELATDFRKALTRITNSSTLLAAVAIAREALGEKK